VPYVNNLEMIDSRRSAILIMTNQAFMQIRRDIKNENIYK